MRPSTDRTETFYFITFIIAVLIIIFTLLQGAGLGLTIHPFIQPLSCVLFPNTNATGSGVC